MRSFKVESKFLICMLLLCCCLVNTSHAQCALSFSGPKCTGAPISFFHNSPGSSNWNWDFGGVGTSTDEIPVFAFQTAGTYKVCLTLRNSSGQQCNACINLEVVEKPKINLSLTNGNIQCFNGNKFTVKNTSTAAGKILRIVYTWSDGEKQLFTNPSIPFNSDKSFVDPAGGSYGLTVETEDEKGCIVIKQFRDFVQVNKKPSLSINVLPNERCDSAYLDISNSSNLLKSELKSFRWEFDDNSSNTIDWKPGPKKWFFGNGPNDGWWGYKLFVETKDGCKDTLIKEQAVRSLVFNPIIVKNKDSACVKDGDIEFKLINPMKRQDGSYDSSAPVIGIKNFSWDFGHPIGSASGRKNAITLNPIHTFGMGAYLIKFAYAHDVCQGGVLYDTVVIVGPQPQIEDIQKGIIIAQNHRYQCKSTDTVQFTNTSKYYHNDKNMWDDDSTFKTNTGGLGHVFDADQESMDNTPQNYRYNDHVVRLWDFGDDFAPQCTTDTKAGINVGKNCNFSRDSLPKHYYKDWEEIYKDDYYSTNQTFRIRTWVESIRACRFVNIDTTKASEHRDYFWRNIPKCNRVSLWLKDTVHPFRCEDWAYTTLSLMPPSAKNVRFTGVYCLGESDPKYGVNFHLDNTKPGCSSNFAMVNFNVDRDSSSWLRFYDSTSGDVQTGTRPGGAKIQVPYSKYGPYGSEFSTAYDLDMLTNPSEGCVKVGIIIGNGLENDQYPACVDTQFYEDAVCFPVLDNKFDILKPKFIGWDTDSILKICSGEELVLRVSPNNYTKAKDVTLLGWQFGANAIGRNFDEAYDNFRYEEYHRFKKHASYPGKLVNYLVVKDVITPLYNTNNSPIEITKNIDTIITAVIHKWDTAVNIGQIWDIAQNKIAPLGFDVFGLTPSEILKIIYSPSCGIDTTGISKKIENAIYLESIVKDVLHFRDTSILPLDTMTIDGKLEQVVRFKAAHNGKHFASFYLQGGEHNCIEASFKPVSVGFYSKLTLSDSIICHSSDTMLRANAQFYYFNSDPNSSGLIDPTEYWAMTDRIKGDTSLNSKEDSVKWDWSKADDNPSNLSTIYGSFPYGARGYGMKGLGGLSNQDVYYRSYGKYLFRITTGDSTRPKQCRDTLSANVYVTDVKAKFGLNLNRPQCSSIIQIQDSSYTLDPCLAENGVPCDSIETYWIDFGEGNGLQAWPREEWKKTQIANNYLSNGKYVITLIVEANRGCRDTFRDTVIIPGPAPRFIPISSLTICENEVVSFVNQSIDPGTSARWIWNFNDGTYSSTNYVNSNGGRDTVHHTYSKGGRYLVTLTQYDSIPGTNKYCPGTYPDTTKFQIEIIVRPPDKVVLEANKERDTLYVCVKDIVNFSVLADLSVYDSFDIYFGDGSKVKTKNPNVSYRYQDSGTYTAYVIPDWDTANGKFVCPKLDTVVVIASGIKADFDIDSAKAPIFCFLNKSKGADDFRWGYYHEKDITIAGDELKEDLSTKSKEEVCNNYARKNGTWYICLEAVNDQGCKDTVCKKITYHFIRELIPYNVFTPSKGSIEPGDGKNDLFVIPNIGVAEYKLVIVNRWGQNVFETMDNKEHWNGRVNNTGVLCPDGTYYYSIQYRFQYEEEQRDVHGVVTLIREP